MSFLDPDAFGCDSLHMSIDVSFDDVPTSNIALPDSSKNRLIRPKLHSISCPAFQVLAATSELNDDIGTTNEKVEQNNINVEGLIMSSIVSTRGSNEENIDGSLNINDFSHGSSVGSITGQFLAKVLSAHQLPQGGVRQPLDDCTQRINVGELNFAGKTKRKMEVDEYENDVFMVHSLPAFPVTRSENFLHRRTFSALSLVDEAPDIFVGDLSRPHSLRILPRVKEELVYISAQTLAEVLTGRGTLDRQEVAVVDCRYPYEFEGGHIQSAVNLFTRQNILKFFLGGDIPHKSSSARALIFHCEFSQMRGPDLARFLRNRDRSFHINKYPKLFYPEIYVLHGGYREFYEYFPTLCCPSQYVTMVDTRFSHDYAKFRRQSKSSVYRESRSATQT